MAGRDADIFLLIFSTSSNILEINFQFKKKKKLHSDIYGEYRILLNTVSLKTVD